MENWNDNDGASQATNTEVWNKEQYPLRKVMQDKVRIYSGLSWKDTKDIGSLIYYEVCVCVCVCVHACVHVPTHGSGPEGIKESLGESSAGDHSEQYENYRTKEDQWEDW